MISLPSIKSYLKFLSDYVYFFKNPGSRGDLRVSLRNLYPILNEDTEETRYDRHYIYHTAWAARKVKEINPKHHIDISSSLFFTVIVSAFIPVKFYDFRPADIVLSGLESKHADLTNLHFKSNSVKSLSCMHTMEHIGLGRYGDSIDPDGDIKAIGELKRVLAIGGNLLFVVPIGKPKIAFNAHRIYSKDQVLSYFSGLKLKEFVLIPDNSKDGHLVVNPSVKLLNKQVYGCGCFWFRKT